MKKENFASSFPVVCLLFLFHAFCTGLDHQDDVDRGGVQHSAAGRRSGVHAVQSWPCANSPSWGGPLLADWERPKPLLSSLFLCLCCFSPLQMLVPSNVRVITYFFVLPCDTGSCFKTGSIKLLLSEVPRFPTDLVLTRCTY